MTSSNFSLLNSLNDQQRKAVEYPSGPILVIAGAGSGKTRVITARIAWLIAHQQQAPHSIVALTFTNKAATEMKERIELLLGDQTHDTKPTVGTFHGYCLQLLRHYGSLMDLATFSLLDADDQQQLINKILKRSNLEKQMTARTVVHHISSRKNSMGGISENNNKLLQDIFVTYEREKELNKSLDFDDLLLKTYQLFTRNPEFRESFQQRIRHILVDEYQDTNLLQHALLKQMSLTPEGSLAINSLCVVGDDDQSIYSWRGATVTNILEFSSQFPETNIVKVEQNYRSAQKILDLANNVIQCNQQRNPKTLWSGKEGTNCVAIIACLSSYQEGDVIAQAAKTARSNNITQSIALLYRAHHQSRILEEALIRASIPYTIIGGLQFYERKEIKDLLAYLRLIVNPYDRISCSRIINCPGRGLGQKFEELLFEAWALHPFATFYEIAETLVHTNQVTGKKATSFDDFIKILSSISPSERPLSALEKIIQQTGYFAYLTETFDRQEAEAKIDNVKELLRAVAHFDQQGLSMDQFLQEVALMQDKSHEQDSVQERVFLMTCHAAKGLEFDLVILTGLEDGVFPSTRATYNEEDVEEERRLFYVGITRACRLLLITHARYRYTYGSMTEQTQSRFVREIPKNLVIHHDISNLPSYQVQGIVEQWLTGKAHIPTKVATFGKTALY